MKEMIEKQMSDAKRGATYRSGLALDDIIPSEVVAMEEELRKEGTVKCKMYGCHSATHKTKQAKSCTYHECRSNSAVEAKMDLTLCRLYPRHYGEFMYLKRKFVMLLLVKYCVGGRII